jgi:predicted site-specific integrase-resolvase
MGDIVTQCEAAKQIGVRLATVQRWIAAGALMPVT